MTERIRLPIAGREEIRDDDAEDFPGRAELRAKIVTARAAGDTEKMRELQRQHREMRLASIGGSSRTAIGRPAAVPAVLRSEFSAESTMPIDPDRAMTGWLCVWGGEVLTATGLRDDSPAIWLVTEAADVLEWLRTVDPARVVVKADHTTAPVGRWHRFEVTDYGLWATAQIADEPAGHAVLDAADDGRAGGLSMSADISRCHDTGNRRDGLPIFAGPLQVIEGSVVVQSADARCEIVSIGGRQPSWQQRRDAVERDEQVRRMWGLT